MLRDTIGQPDPDWIQAAASPGFVPCQIPQSSAARSSNGAQAGPFARAYQVPIRGPARLQVRIETGCYDYVRTRIGSSRSNASHLAEFPRDFDPLTGRPGLRL